MRIKVERLTDIAETEVIIRCGGQSDDAESIIATLRLFENKISVKADGKNYIFPAREIFYFESVDDKVFCYTEKDVYETNLKLYELEEIFRKTVFLRINKNIVLNANKIKNFAAALNGRMEATLINGEKVEISRNYVPALKLLLGGLKK